MRNAVKIVGLWGLVGLIVLGFVLFALAFSFNLSDRANPLVITLWSGIGVVGAGLVLFNRAKRTKAILVMAVALVVATVWWAQIKPSNTRDWAPELARTVTAQIDGDIVVLRNIRNFPWQNQTIPEQNWVTRRFDLTTLDTVEMALSYWGIDAIAHTLVSFGFSDGQHIVFSAEIRRENGESFSELGGLFKQFELVLIAATEDDILKLRTNARDPKEDVYLYPLDISQQGRQELFLAYAGLANELAQTPRWYNTVTANCTTMIYHLVKSYDPKTLFNWRFLLSGHLPEYFAQKSMLSWPQPYGDFRARAAISKKAQNIQTGEIYSDVIRQE